MVVSVAEDRRRRDARIVRLRDRGWSLRQIAAAVGLSHQGVAVVLRRVGRPRPGELDKLAAYRARHGLD